LLAHAVKELHPNRFIDPSEAGMVARSKLSQLILLLGKGDDKRSAAVAFDDLVGAASDYAPQDYARKGLAKELGKVIAHDAVLIALVAAAPAPGAGNVRNSGANSVMASDPFGYEIQVSGIASTALSGGS
jgi:hypothetical protein